MSKNRYAFRNIFYNYKSFNKNNKKWMKLFNTIKIIAFKK